MLLSVGELVSIPYLAYLFLISECSFLLECGLAACQPELKSIFRTKEETGVFISLSFPLFISYANQMFILLGPLGANFLFPCSHGKVYLARAGAHELLCCASDAKACKCFKCKHSVIPTKGSCLPTVHTQRLGSRPHRNSLCLMPRKSERFLTDITFFFGRIK